MARYDESNIDEPVDNSIDSYMRPEDIAGPYEWVYGLLFALFLLFLMFAFGGGTDSGWMAY